MIQGWPVKMMWAIALLVSGASTASSGPEAVYLPILVYHQIRESADGPPDSLEAISIERFEAQMGYLKEHGYVTLSAEETVAFVRGEATPVSKVVAIHFDDGWKSAQLAIPVLDRHDFKATFWIIAGKGIGWPHMDWEEIQSIARNPRYGIGSHSMTHPWKDGDTLLDWIEGRVPGKGEREVRWELAKSRQTLEAQLRRPVPYFAWPRGIHSPSLVRLASEAGYLALFTVDDGVNRRGTDPLSMRRTMIHGSCDGRAFEQTLRDGVYRACDPVERSGAFTPVAQPAVGSQAK